MHIADARIMLPCVLHTTIDHSPTDNGIIMPQQNHRTEQDSLGTKRIPVNAYYGIQTVRALENFPITGVPISHYPFLPIALAHIKRASAEANAILGLLPSKKRRAISAACTEIVKGRWHDQFVVDVIQGGAGTSTNMNANEVIANRALELLGRSRGEYEYLHPLDDVNLSQSTNDVYPTAVKLAAVFMLNDLTAAVDYCARSFERKGKQLRHVLTMGRTHAGCGSDDAGPGVRRLRRDVAGGH
jgi:aspartate ammonia-lyase